MAFLKRSDIYHTSEPASGSVWQPFVDFADPLLGPDVVDIGCGYGEYMLSFRARGHKVSGVEPNKEFAKVAQSKKLDVKVTRGEDTGFTEKSFDTAVIFEVLQHALDPSLILKEAARLVRHNILITVPNVEGLEELAKQNLTYNHLRADDNRNFFTKESLEELCRQISPNFTVKKAEPVLPENLIPAWATFPWWIVTGLGIYKPKFHNRLYAEIIL